VNTEERYADYLEHGLDDGETSFAAREGLDSVRELLVQPEVWAEPPADLGDAVVDAVRAATVAKPTTPARPARPAPGRASHRSRNLLLAAAAAAVLVAVAVTAVVAARDNSHAQRFALTATALAPDATGSATARATGSGLEINLSVDHLPPAAPSTFYQAWMKGPKGSVPIGTFHAHRNDGPIHLWSGVDPREYPTMTVTIQREGAGPQSSGRVVLTGKVPHD
jgi:anti-sigma-K factor RskA